MERPTESPNSVEWKVQQPWILYANKLEGKCNRLAEDKRELMEALEWIKGASDVSTDRCHCVRPNGVLALHSYAKRALAAIKAREVE